MHASTPRDSDHDLVDMSLNVRSKAGSYREFVRSLLAIHHHSYTYHQFNSLTAKPATAVLIRHDVDHSLENALVMARIEAALGVRATYFLLPPGDYGKDENYYGTLIDGKIAHRPTLIETARQIQSLGHEIGIHNDFVQLSYRLKRPIDELLREEIAYFRSHGIAIHGTASHGSRFARQHGFVNYEIFSDRCTHQYEWRTVALPEGNAITLPCMAMRNMGLDYEAYDFPFAVYISDAGGLLSISSEHQQITPFDYSGDDLRDLDQNVGKGVTIALIHPEHWSTFALSDAITPESIHGARSSLGSPTPASTSPEPAFFRKDGKPVRIAVRGDCVCRRGVSMNPDLFVGGYEMVVNEKATNAQFSETIDGITPTLEQVGEYVDHASMAGSLKNYFQFQFDRSVLDMRDIDLIVMDTYSDMNFQLWRHKTQKWSIWIHPKYTDMERLKQDFTKEALPSVDEAVGYIEKIIARIRSNNPDVPVLFMYQPIEYYRKLDGRRDFYDVPSIVASRVANVYGVDRLDISELGVADMGSCGPEQTLHFDAQTYRRMIASAWSKGLCRHFQRDGDGGDVSEYDGAATPLPAELADFSPRRASLDFVSYGGGRQYCASSCAPIPEGAMASFEQYIAHPEKGDDPAALKRFTPMTIALDDLDIDEFEDYVKSFGKGAQIRQSKKASRLGYYSKIFSWNLHIPDIHEINTSKETRSGGPMRGSYLRTIEEMGGAPTQDHPIVMPRCDNHWGIAFGTFKEEPGYKQGVMTTNEKLYAYIFLRRMGDIALYSQILGHGAYLHDGVLTLLHLSVVRWLHEQRDGYARGLRYLLYGGAQNGGQSLYRWKRQSGFIPKRLLGFSNDSSLRSWLATTHQAA